jgi:hypothetical protein
VGRLGKRMKAVLAFQYALLAGATLCDQLALTPVLISLHTYLLTFAPMIQ